MRDDKIGVVGTARPKKKWPPNHLCDYHAKDNPEGIKPKSAQFNDFFYTYDEFGTLCARWMDNNLVYLVSTVHKFNIIVKKIRRKPRKNAVNGKFMDKIWGENGKAAVCIPLLVDNYNHWMGGVDLADQRIAYYMPDLRCRRNWIPLFIQMLGLVQNNSYLTHSSQDDKTKIQMHKKFLLSMIEELMFKAHFYLRWTGPIGGGNRNLVKRKREEEARDDVSRKSDVSMKKKQKSHLHIADFPQRFNKELNHAGGMKAPNNERGACVMCSDLYFKKLERCNTDAEKRELVWKKEVKRPYTICLGCSSDTLKCFLCKNHHEKFHSTP